MIPGQVTRTLLLAITGSTVTNWAIPSSREPVPVILRLDKSLRDNTQALKAIYVPGINGHPVPLEDLVNFKRQTGNQVRYRRNMMPVTTVVADLDRSVVQPLTVQLAVSKNLTTEADSVKNSVCWLSPPVQTAHPRLYWSGEWEMTRDVYRDLGTAGAVVMLLIYLLLAGWFSSYTLPFLIMLPIPLIFIGVLPAHWLLGLNIAGTGILGIIALAGIVARNSILLVDFIELRKKRVCRWKRPYSRPASSAPGQFC